MKKYAAVILALLFPAVSAAQSIPPMDRRVTLQGPTGLNWALSTKADTKNGSLLNPTVTGGTLSGTTMTGGELSGPTITGGKTTSQSITTPTISAGTAVGLEISATLGKVFGASVSRYLNSKLMDVISVRDFGAKGDGVADDLPAINAAINYSKTTTYAGGRIWFPDGVYNVSGPIILTGSGFSLVGTTPRAVTIRATFTSGNVIQIGQAPNDLRSNQNNQIFGLNIVAASAMTSGAAIYADGVYNFHIDNVRTGENIYDSVDIENTVGSTYGVMIRNLWVAHALHRGVIIGALATNLSQVVTDVFLSDSMILPSGSLADCGLCLYGVGGFYAAGVDMTSSSGDRFATALHVSPNAGSDVNAVMLSRVLADDSTNENIRFDGDGFIADVTMTNVWASTSRQASGIAFNNTRTDGVTISSSAVDSNAQNGIVINYGKNIAIIGSRILNNSMAETGSYDGIGVGVGTATFSITDNQIGNGGFFNLNGGTPSIVHQRWGVNINKYAAQGFVVSNNRGEGNVLGIVNDQTTGTNKSVSGNVNG
ncbi:glycosyl hydrolase family 28-related protein [Acetobacter sp.]|uniref:glycosyl hydrolase family 28-related protein n=1 Tax=Acetobacter sp. TaxID=440 RepID=UPI0039EA5B0A